MAARSNVALLPKSVRCAVYTRKSTDEGLDQDFNSLDAQREAGEAYVRSQVSEGWSLVAAHRFLFADLRFHLLGWPAFLAPDGRCAALRPAAPPA